MQDAELFSWLRGLYPIWAGLTPEMVAGGYRKKYLRATSRLLALSRFQPGDTH